MSPLLEELLFANWSLDVATFNITKARQIMQSMGFGTGWDTTFPGTSEVNWSNTTFAIFNYSYNIGNTFRENLLFLLQDNLDKIGIEITDAGMDPL
jgi:ABC-type transport system substrate-binding protein